MIGLRIALPTLERSWRAPTPLPAPEPELDASLEDAFDPSSKAGPMPYACPSAPELKLGIELLLMVLASLRDQLVACREAGAFGPEGFGSSERLAPGAWGRPQAPQPKEQDIESPTSDTSPVSPPPTADGKVKTFLDAALRQKGDKYVFGAETKMSDADPTTFDCSELVEWASHQAGVDVPDGSSNQKSHCTPISVEDALHTPGALLFRPGHVAISLGDGRTIEARGRKWGVGVFSAKDRFTSAGLIPGLNGR